jgi:2-aminoadipate transaminase
MLAALRKHFGEEAHWTAPQGGLFIWATLPQYIDTTNLLAQCTNVAFVPGRAAYMDAEGRQGSSSMRLNFAGLPEEEIREGIGRIAAMAERPMRVFGAVTKTPRPQRSTTRAPGPPVAPATPDGKPEHGLGQPGTEHEAKPAEPRGEKRLADVVELRRRRAGGR